jgi:hypothetical protein
MSATGPGQSVELLSEVLAVLNAAQIQYAVIGALAVSVHGVVRASQDADAVIHATASELGVVNTKLTDLGFKTELRRGDIDDPIPALLLVSDRHGNRVDLLAGLRGMDVAVYSRAIQVTIPGTTIPLCIASLEDLVAMKLFAGGPQDLLDARRCIAVAGDELDTALLRRVVAGFGRDAVSQCEKLLIESAALLKGQ